MSNRTEKRNLSRHQFIFGLRFGVADDPERPFRGIGTNVSERGIGIYTFSPLSRDQVIAIRKNLAFGRKTAVVRWATKVAEGFYRAGLEFLPDMQ